MSEKEDTVFQIYYRGKFVTEKDGDVTYSGGERHMLQTQAEFLFRGLMEDFPMPLYGQRIWYKGKFSLKVSKMIESETRFRKHCTSLPGPTGEFEVSENGMKYAVDMRAMTCSCRRWDLTGIPCRHALRIVSDHKKTYKTDNLVSHWYLTSKWQQQYSDSIKPLRGIKFWKPSGESTLHAPPREISKGRKKKPQQRIKGVNESPTKGKKVTQHARVMHCSRCGLPEHNCTKCPNSGVPCKPRPPKKQKTTRPEEIAVSAGEGPAQTQPSQS